MSFAQRTGGAAAADALSPESSYGLRGGVSVALVQSIPSPSGEARVALLTVNYLIFLFSILIQGLTISYVVNRLLSGP
ncbi:hypothetical protein M8009_15160 [Halomonas sp. ATCH28]|uniref:Uncharacterized protein n=1 Tax=Halomonas gemina TaxID=2945105 RepID=A0ABT0T476_9GAMM|nr:hypothetical protein [Halomonas gemina]MCL7941627.1 hypothetical protein [Halomonas gemina]